MIELVFTPQQSDSRVSDLNHNTLLLVWKAGEIGHQGYTDCLQHDGSTYQLFSITVVQALCIQ